MLTSKDYSTIFHEIKNSITLIGSSLQLVEKKHPEIVNFPYWTESMSEIAFLRNMVTELSTARLCGKLNLRPVDLYSYIDDVRCSFSTLSPNNFQCDIISPKNLPPVQIDPLLMKQALTNLLKNAYEAMNRSGTVVIQLTSLSSAVRIDIIDHGGGVYSVYMHNSARLVSVGDRVTAGQTIAQVGSTGLSTGNHLHFGVSVNGVYVNPWNYLR